MPNLGDYLGSLLGEITRARVQADLEAARVAEIYAGHPLLRRFPIPRVRLPNVTIDAPVIISEVDEGEPPESCKPEQPPFDADRLVGCIERYLVEELEPFGIKPIKRDLEILRRTLRKKSRRLLRRHKPAAPVSLFAKDLSRVIPPLVRKYRLAEQKLTDDDLQTLQSGAIDVARQELLEMLPIPPSIRVSALTHEIKEIGDTERVVRLKLSVVEEGVEWATIDEDGEEREVLLPE